MLLFLVVITKIQVANHMCSDIDAVL